MKPEAPVTQTDSDCDPIFESNQVCGAWLACLFKLYRQKGTKVDAQLSQTCIL